MKNIGRRNFLKNAGLYTLLGPQLYKMLIANVVMNSFGEAIGSDEDILNGNTLCTLFLSGGPPRWMWDLPLQSTIGENAQIIQQLKMLCTNFENMSDFNSGRYRSVDCNGLILPHLWEQNIATSSGTSPMASLTNNMIFLRGIELPTDGHTQAAGLHITPNPGGKSLGNSTAYISRSLSPFRAMCVGDPGGVGNFSLDGGSIYNIGSNISWDYIADVMSAFTQNTSPRILRETAVGDIIDNIYAEFRNRYNWQGSKATSFFNERQNAKRMFAKVQEGFNDTWGDLVAKYENIISLNQGIHIPGVTSSPIIANGTNDFLMGDGNRLNQVDIVDVVNNTNIDWQLARKFAITEFVLKESLTNFLFVTFGSVNLGNNHFIDFDPHFTGGINHMVWFSKYYHNFSACLFELRSQLQSRGNWNKTLIEIASDFGRAATANVGSEHAGKATNVSLFGGMINGGRVLGNIYTSSSYSFWPGMHGEAAPQSSLSGLKMGIGNVATTIAGILGGRSPIPRETAVLSLNAQGQVVTNLTTRNITRT